MTDLSIRRQLELWVKGESVHNDDRGECCPDFSCCNKEVDTPLAVKEIFFNAYHTDNEKVCHRLLMEFLSNALSGESVHIAGLDASRREEDGNNVGGE